MQTNVSMWIHDFMNLVFGQSEESTFFVEKIVRPEVANYYNYPLDDLEKREIRLNALYFSLLELVGLRCINLEERRAKTLKSFTTGISKIITDGGIQKNNVTSRDTLNSQTKDSSKQRDNA